MPDEENALDLVSDAVIDGVAAKILALYRQTTLDFSIAVGQLVVDDLYGGDIQRWRDHGAKDGSLRKLATKLSQAGRELSVTRLQQAIGTLDLELRVGVTARPQLTATHVRAVIGLPAEQQEALLGKSEAKDWNSEKLEKEATKARAKLATRTGRKPLPAFVRTVNRWERDLVDEESTFGDLDRAASLDAAEKERLRAAVLAMKARCDGLLETLAELGLATPPAARIPSRSGPQGG